MPPKLAPSGSLMAYGFKRTSVPQTKDSLKLDESAEDESHAVSNTFQEPPASRSPSNEVSKASSSDIAEAKAESESAGQSHTTHTMKSPVSRHLKLAIHKGDIFSAPPNNVLIHACNTQGSWGAGIAAAFRTKYPSAYKVYRAHCLRTHDPRTDPVTTGSCLLIPPCEDSTSAPKHWIACLFTSAKYGKGKDKSDVILRNTDRAVKEMLQMVKSAEGDGKVITGLRMCKINSARFGVPWRRTVEVVEGIEASDGERSNIAVWTIDDD